jgi:hypothetical protein
VRFERVTLVTCGAVADVTRQVYERVLADWRPKVTYSLRLTELWLIHCGLLTATFLLTFLLTHLPTYSLPFLLTYLLTHFPSYSLTCLLTYSLTYLLTYLLIHLPTYSRSKVSVAVRSVPTSDAGLVVRANAIAGDDAWFRARHLSKTLTLTMTLTLTTDPALNPNPDPDPNPSPNPNPKPSPTPALNSNPNPNPKTPITKPQRPQPYS